GVKGHRRDALADGKTLHVGPDLDNLSTEFVPHHLARSDEGASGVRVQVAAADTTGFNTDDNVVSSWLRIGDSLHPYGTNAFEDCSLHRQLLSRTPGISHHRQVLGLHLWQDQATAWAGMCAGGWQRVAAAWTVRGQSYPTMGAELPVWFDLAAAIAALL